MRPLIIGIGNIDRSDDGAGILVAKLLGERSAGFPVDVVACSGDPSVLMDLWRDRDQVEVVDAAQIKSKTIGTTFCLDGKADDLGPLNFSASTHAFGLKEAIGLSRALDSLPKSLRLWLIVASNYELLGEMHPEVSNGAASVALELEKKYLLPITLTNAPLKEENSCTNIP